MRVFVTGTKLHFDMRQSTLVVPNLMDRLSPRFSFDAEAKLWVPKHCIDVLTTPQVAQLDTLFTDRRNASFDPANTKLSEFIFQTAIASGAFDAEFRRVTAKEIQTVVLVTGVCTLDAENHSFLVQAADGLRLRQEPVLSVLDFLQALKNRKPHSYRSVLYCQSCATKGNPTMAIAVWSQTAGKTGSVEQLPFGNTHDQTQTTIRLRALAGIDTLRTLRPSNVGGLKLSIDNLEQRNMAIVAGSFLRIPQRLMSDSEVPMTFKYPIVEVSLTPSSATNNDRACWQLFTTTVKQDIYLRFAENSKFIDVNQSRICQIARASLQGYEVWRLVNMALNFPEPVSLIFLGQMREWAGKISAKPGNPSIEWNLFVPLVNFETRYQVHPISYNLQLVTLFLQNMQTSVEQFDVNLYLTLMPSKVVALIQTLVSKHASALILVRKIDCSSMCRITSSTC